MNNIDRQLFLAGPDAILVDPVTSGSRWWLSEPKLAISNVILVFVEQLDVTIVQY